MDRIRAWYRRLVAWLVPACGDCRRRWGEGWRGETKAVWEVDDSDGGLRLVEIDGRRLVSRPAREADPPGRR